MELNKWTSDWLVPRPLQPLDPSAPSHGQTVRLSVCISHELREHKALCSPTDILFVSALCVAVSSPDCQSQINFRSVFTWWRHYPAFSSVLCRISCFNRLIWLFTSWMNQLFGLISFVRFTQSVTNIWDDFYRHNTADIPLPNKSFSEPIIRFREIVNYYYE